MELPTATKKKKRRTRKCLNEIRKRSRRPMRSDIFEQTSQQREKINRAEEGQAHRLITMNRLTFNMFPKAIRSETVTRPLLEEIKQKSSHTILPDKNINCSSKDPEVERFEHCNSAASNNSMPMFDLEEESLQEHVSNHSDIPLRNYLDSHSPTCEVYNTKTPAELQARIYSTTTTTSFSSQTSDGDHGQELYEEIMSKISSHLNKVTSATIKEDVIKNTKVNLQNLFNKSWSKEYKISMVEHEKSNKSTTTTLQPLKDSIIQNPLDYIRLRQEQQQRMHDDCHSDLAELFSSAPAATASYSAHQTHSPLTYRTDCTRNIALYDTPEYNYYPHRLN